MDLEAEPARRPQVASTRVGVGALLDSIEDLATALDGCTDVEQLGERLLDALDESGHADGMALFRVDGQGMHLVAMRRREIPRTARRPYCGCRCPRPSPHSRPPRSTTRSSAPSRR